uniref:PLAT domain-containing protein n=1 Tax=Rhodnius prolixus TaxID=13249 RepID=T1HTD8_RHOPR
MAERLACLVGMLVIILEDERPVFVHFLDSKKINLFINHNTSYIIRDNKDHVFVYIGILPDKKTPAGTEVSYEIRGHSVFCKVWGDGSWVSGACQVGEDFTPAQVHCICSHLSLFSAAVFPVPNKIDFIHDIELLTTINMNFYAAVMVGILLLLLIILITWGRIMDKRDEIKEATRKLGSVERVSFSETCVNMEDNYSTDQYIYLIAVYTGNKVFSGTTANVGIKIYGELGNSH